MREQNESERGRTALTVGVMFVAQMLFCGGASAGVMSLAFPALVVSVLCFGSLLLLGFTDVSVVLRIRAGRVEFEETTLALHQIEVTPEESALTIEAYGHAFCFRAEPEQVRRVATALQEAKNDHGHPSDVPATLGTLTER